MISPKRTPNSLLYTLLLPAALLLQSQASASGGNLLFYGLAALALLILFFIIISVADNFMVIESRAAGIDEDEANMGLYPKINELLGRRLPKKLEGKKVYTFKKGYDIPMEGEPSDRVENVGLTTRHAIMPPDFVGLMPIPKVTVEVGDSVKAGDIVFYDKKKDRIKFAAPVSGEVIEIKRGLKRSIDSVIILADKTQESRSYNLPAPSASREDLVEFLLESGVWPAIRQRPFNIVADPEVVPRDIFISTFDTGPLAPNANLVLDGKLQEFQAGIDVLRRLTNGLIYLGLDGRGEAESAFAGITGVEQRYFRGPHPAGNVGIQAHHIHPIGNGSDTCWTMDVNGVILLGNLFKHGKYDTSRVVALTGAPLADPHHVRTYAGANLGELIDQDGLANVRIISGNVLSGTKLDNEGFLGFFDNQVTIIEEGNEAEMFGWLLPLKSRASISPTIPTFGKAEITTNTHGERRAFVVNNDYERVMPMDIYLTQLMKSIMISDFEAMEGLGIYELVAEDVALAEFACVSKQPLQYLLKDGHRLMIEQG